MGTQLPSPKRGRAPKFLAHVYCGQMAGWIKMLLSMEVGLGPGHIVLDGEPAPPIKGHSPPKKNYAILTKTVNAYLSSISYCTQTCSCHSYTKETLRRSCTFKQLHLTCHLYLNDMNGQSPPDFIVFQHQQPISTTAVSL